MSSAWPESPGRSLDPEALRDRRVARRAILGELGLAPRASAVLDSLVDYVSARDR